jgi:hypothetical protein
MVYKKLFLVVRNALALYVNLYFDNLTLYVNL